ncbi:XdhC family protein [Candidatus Poriferisodalis sp.]|uniref:XdhC family protein n=1 Tax=Candidatus Poriferisodalis sp. TaxID=3101277 RepID=UPI003B59303C
MYGIAVSVTACLRGGTRVDVAWNLDTSLTPRFDPADAVGITPGGGKLGTLLGGALDSRLIELASAKPTSGRVVEIELDAIESTAVGVEAGAVVRILVAPADTLPEELWDQLLERQRVTLVAELDGDMVTATTISVDGTADRSVVFKPDSVVTTWSPRPTLVVMGSGPMANAVAEAGDFVGCNVQQCTGPEAAIGLAGALSPLDGIVVIGHDIEATGRVLLAAVNSRAGYIGSVGPQPIQAVRLDWLAYRGVTDTDRIFAPAGIDIGARTPSEVAVSVLAEMIAARDQPPS